VPFANPPQARFGLPTALVLFALSLIFALALAEGALRLLGFQPWQPAGVWAPDVDPEHETPLMTRPHATRSWTNQPGTYRYAGYSAEVDSISVTINADESRSTGRSPPPSGAPALVFTGGSNTMGWAISDHETYPWKLQQRFPRNPVFNWGVPGYGSLQALLTLEEQLGQVDGRKIAFYGLIGHHYNRNVLHKNWMRLFAAPGKGRMPPYATLDASGTLQRHPPGQWRPWPLKDRLAIVNAAENAAIRLLARRRGAQMVPVMHGLLQQMQRAASRHDAALVVVLLKLDPARADALEAFLANAGIRVLNCVPDDLGPQYRVKGEGHPNDALNTLWAGCIAGYLEREFRLDSQ